MGRWYDVFVKESRLQAGHWDALLFILTFIALEDGYWESLWKSPLVLVNSKEAPHESLKDVATSSEAAASSSVGPAGKAGAVKSSETELRKLKSTCKNNKGVSIRILASEWRGKLWRCICHVVEPARIAHLTADSNCRTPDGSLHHHVAWARGGCVNEVHAILTRCLGGEGFSELGFEPSTLKAVLVTESVQEEVDLATKMVEFGCALAGVRYHWNCQLMYGLPSLLLLSMDKEEVYRLRGLELCAFYWDLLVKSEMESKHDSFIHNVRQHMPWVQNAWCLEQLVELSEMQFKRLTDRQRNAVLTLFRGFSSTLVAEDSMKVLRYREGASDQGWLGVKDRYHTLLSSRLLQDHARRQPQSTATTAATAANTIPKQMFHPPRTGSSIPQTDLNHLTSTNFTSRSLDAWILSAGILNEALLRCNGDWTVLKSAWQSLFLDVGAVVVSEKSEAFLVLDVTVYGVVVWHGSIKQGSDGTRWFEMDSKASQEVCQVMLFDMRRTRVCVVTAEPPARRSTLTKGINGIRLLVGPPEKPWVKAAATGYKNMTNEYLKKAWLWCSVPGSVPTTQAELVKGLVKHHIADISDEQLAQILSMRSGKRTKVVKTVFEDADMAAAAQDYIAKEDRQEQSTLEKLSVRKVEPVRTSTGAASAKTSGSSDVVSNSAKTVHVKPAKLAATMSLDDAKRYAPQVKGCTVRREQEWHLRIAGSYIARKEGQKYRKVTYSEKKGSERDAFLTVLKWLWSVHEECTGERCPWEFAKSE
eukprot:4171080-Amphidinium_carterae.2